MLTDFSKTLPVKLVESSHRGGVTLKRLPPMESCDHHEMLKTA